MPEGIASLRDSVAVDAWEPPQTRSHKIAYVISSGRKDERTLATIQRFEAALARLNPDIYIIDPALVRLEHIKPFLEKCDAVILPGRDPNVHPENYGQTPAPDLEQQFDKDRDAVAIKIVKEAVALKKPVFAVCGGMQELQVALGGELIQDISKVAGEIDHAAGYRDRETEADHVHDVDVELGGLFAKELGETSFRVNSIHGQGFTREMVADGLQIEATCGDVVEAISYKGIAIAAQWHPEKDLSNPNSQRIFDIFSRIVETNALQNDLRNQPAPIDAAAFWQSLQEQAGPSIVKTFAQAAGITYRGWREKKSFQLGATAVVADAWYRHRAILRHASFEDALATRLAGKLGNSDFSFRKLRRAFRKAYRQEPQLLEAARADLAAVPAKDPAVDGTLTPFLDFKSFQALQAARVAHHYWQRSNDGQLSGLERSLANRLALHLQSIISERFAVDIHPAAKIGKGVGIDHGTGVVIGETAEVGDGVWFLHGVTLGGTNGKREGERRHPIVGNGVTLNAGTNIIGPVTIGTGAVTGAGAIVTRDVDPYEVVVGVNKTANRGITRLPRFLAANA